MSASIADLSGRRIIDHQHPYLTGKCEPHRIDCLPHHARGFANRKSRLHVDSHGADCPR